MTELIAKVESEYKNILSKEANILPNFDISTINAIDFTTSYKLEDDEWFIINNFSEKKFFIEQCNPTFSTVSLNQIKDIDYKKISAIAVFQNGQKHFQRITPSCFVNEKSMLDFSGEPKIIEHRKQIEIKKESDAVYLGDSDVLYFKHIDKLKIIFPDIEELHRKATQDEVDTFINNDFISLSGMMSNTTIRTQNRKRIADIGLKYNNLSNVKKEKLIEYAKQKAGVEINEDGSFVIKSETDLKKILYAMDQRYYYADIYEENRFANSVRVVNG